MQSNHLPTSASSSSTSSPNQPQTQAQRSNTSGGSKAKAMGSSTRGGGKRRKVAKACLTCQKSHLTCDELRPCTRCLKKGIGDQCVEGVRKIAKYLLEGDDRGGTTTPNPPTRQQTHTASPTLHLDSLPPESTGQGQGQGHGTDVWLAPAMEGSGDLFGGVEGWVGESGNAGGNDLAEGSGGMGVDSNLFPTAAADEFEMFDAMFTSMSPIFPFLEPNTNLFDDAPTGTYDLNPNPNPNLNAIPPQPALSPLEEFVQQQQQRVQGVQPVISPWSLPPISNQGGGNTNGSNAEGVFDPARWVEVGSGNEEKVGKVGGVRGMTASEVYKNVTKPYDYTEGYHVLMEYLSVNFEQKDVLRVVRALASYRPSLIALQMPMSEEDEVFLERSFQRTLIELEKLISHTSTPTAVWRRTGEIVYANPEYFKLLQRSEIEVLGTGGKRVYVYQLLSKESVIAYWENFSVHAFENTTQNFFQAVDIKLGGDQGDGKSLRCSCCFTIRRDVFDLPSVVIGQFLPVPVS